MYTLHCKTLIFDPRNQFTNISCISVNNLTPWGHLQYYRLVYFLVSLLQNSLWWLWLCLHLRLRYSSLTFSSTFGFNCIFLQSNFSRRELISFHISSCPSTFRLPILSNWYSELQHSMYKWWNPKWCAASLMMELNFWCTAMTPSAERAGACRSCQPKWSLGHSHTLPQVLCQIIPSICTWSQFQIVWTAFNVFSQDIICLVIKDSHVFNYIFINHDYN